ncbi:hypothetical protein [Sporocytophaga myxococcoides]|uniref:hypothetical protein n=1 Tax=Sporocytophaga myxococcoides TaxID=153721 RepID=UPI000411BC83|nr:hypothetical protein [Sporocytophaga myxococcoides]
MKPEYISSIDYINSLTFEYIETYSLQRGERFEKQREQEIKILQKLRRRNKSLNFEELKQVKGLEELYGTTQYLLDDKGNFHIFSEKIAAFSATDNEVINLVRILQTKIREIPAWMCAPIYRDAIVFYDKNKKIISALNVCLSCEYIAINRHRNINADEETYKQLRQFFIDCGHKIEDKNL